MQNGNPAMITAKNILFLAEQIKLPQIDKEYFMGKHYQKKNMKIIRKGSLVQSKNGCTNSFLN